MISQRLHRHLPDLGLHIESGGTQTSQTEGACVPGLQTPDNAAGCSVLVGTPHSTTVSPEREARQGKTAVCRLTLPPLNPRRTAPRHRGFPRDGFVRRVRARERARERAAGDVDAHGKRSNRPTARARAGGRRARASGDDHARGLHRDAIDACGVGVSRARTTRTSRARSTRGIRSRSRTLANARARPGEEGARSLSQEKGCP